MNSFKVISLFTLFSFSVLAEDSSPDMNRVLEQTRLGAQESVRLENVENAIGIKLGEHPQRGKIQAALNAELDSLMSYSNYVTNFNAKREAENFSGADKGNFFLTESYLRNLANLPRQKAMLMQAFTNLRAVPSANADDNWTTEPLNKDTGLAGFYQDFHGGTMVISKNQSQFFVTLSVVRGPTHHTGDLEGTLKSIASDKVRLNVKNSEGKLCSLEMRINSLKHLVVKVLTTEACQEFHGARAYFDGTFYKTPENLDF